MNKIVVYRNASDLERAGICHKNTVPKWIKEGHIVEVMQSWMGKTKRVGLIPPFQLYEEAEGCLYKEKKFRTFQL